MSHNLEEIVEVAIEAGLAAAVVIGANSLGWLQLGMWSPAITAGLTVLFAAIYEFAIEKPTE
jgi:CHASE2 domain-containing sensor protein